MLFYGKYLKTKLIQNTTNSYFNISEEFIFFADEEGENLNNAETKYSEGKKDYCIREKTLSYGPVRKVINRIKTGRWGEWEDLITEMDGQDR